MTREYYKIKNIEPDPEQWWPAPFEVLCRSYEEAEKHAKESNFTSYRIEKLDL